MVTIPDITSLVLVASRLLAVSLWGKFRPLRPRFVFCFSVVGFRERPHGVGVESGC